MRERRDKCLFYYYDAKWNSSHKCQQPKLFLMEEVEEELVEAPTIEEETGKEEILDFVTT